MASVQKSASSSENRLDDLEARLAKYDRLLSTPMPEKEPYYSDQPVPYNPETEVELRKDIYTPDKSAGGYNRYITKELGLTRITPEEMDVIMKYQSLIESFHRMGLSGGEIDLSGLFEAEKMAFVKLCSAKEGFLIQNLNTARSIAETKYQESLGPGQKSSGLGRLLPSQPKE